MAVRFSVSRVGQVLQLRQQALGELRTEREDCTENPPDIPRPTRRLYATSGFGS